MPAKYMIKKPSSGFMCYIELTDPDIKRLTVKGNKRVVCTLNKALHIHAAILKTKEGSHYIMIGNKYLKQLNLKVNSLVDATFKIDTTELQFNIPEEFGEVIQTDEAAKKVYDSLTNGNKRGLIAIVNMVKSPDKKIERSLLIAEKLKLGVTSPQKMLRKN